MPMGNDKMRRKRLTIIITFSRSSEGKVRGKGKEGWVGVRKRNGLASAKCRVL